MASITYTAKRRLRAGVNAGDTVQFDFAASRLDYSDKYKKRTGQSLGLLRETVLYGYDSFWNITAEFVPAADIDRWREFFASVSAGEQFTFDAYGTIAAPDAPVSAGMDSDSYAESRIASGTQFYNISFKVYLV